VKTILYYGPERQHFEELLDGLSQVPSCLVVGQASPPYVVYRNTHMRFVVDHDPQETRHRLRDGYYNLVLVDLRNRGEDQERARAQVERVMGLLDAMAREKDVEARYGFHRVVALVGGPSSEREDQLLLDLGARGVGRVVRNFVAAERLGGGAEPASRSSHCQHFLDVLLATMARRQPGKRALCAAGGGITAAYFELGALKCLADCLGPDTLSTFDMYFGISAGAVVSAMLANGFAIDEIMAAIAGHEGPRLPPITLSLLRLEHLNYMDYVRRAESAAHDLWQWLGRLVRGKARFSLDGLVMGHADFLAPPFVGNAFERKVRGIFNLEGATNDFRLLDRKLFVGATDQDSRTPVLFGDEGWDDVPISLAVQASMSINPAIRATKIRDRFYEDGAVTRTSLFLQAINKGADLVVVLNPFVPYVSKEPGFAEKRGILYNVDQDIRALTYTRFESTRDLVLHHYPQVSSYTFLPANRLRRLMAVNPMDHRPYLPIWRGAYLSTLQRIEQLRYRMAGDAATHGLTLDTSPAEAIAARLRATAAPKFADFFVDGKVELRLPAASSIRQPAPTEAAAAALGWPPAELAGPVGA